MRCAIVVLLLLSVVEGGFFGKKDASAATGDAPGCSFSWKALGCTPSKDCKLKFRPGFGTFGPCVARDAAKAAEECADGAAAKEAEAATPEAAPATDAEQAPADAPAADTPAAEAAEGEAAPAEAAP